MEERHLRTFDSNNHRLHSYFLKPLSLTSSVRSLKANVCWVAANVDFARVVLHADFLQGSILAPTLPIYYDFIRPISNSLHCFADDATPYCSLPHSSVRQATTNIHQIRTVPSASLASDVKQISVWCSSNHVHFNSFETWPFWFTRKSPYSLPLNCDYTSLHFTEPLPLLGLPIKYSLCLPLCWHLPSELRPKLVFNLAPVFFYTHPFFFT